MVQIATGVSVARGGQPGLLARFQCPAGDAWWLWILVGSDVLIAAFSHLHVILPKCSNSNPATGQDAQERSFLVAPLLDRGFLVCGQYFVFMQLDRVYVRRLLVVLVVHISHAPLPAHYLSL